MAWFIEGLETVEDRENEVAVLEYFELKTGHTYVQTKLLTRYDADIYDKFGRQIAIAEIKCRRNCNHDTYRSAIIRTDKWYGCKKIAKEKGVKFIILYRYDDGVFLLNETDTVVGQDGRYINVIRPFNNPHGGEEEVINFPTRLLKKI